MFPSVILAGGRGSRLDPLTKYLPKPMWTILGGSLLDHHIQRLADAGASPILITCAYMEEVLCNYVSLCYPYCELIRTGNKVTTPEDAIGSVADRITEDFLVVHADHVFSQNPFGDLLAQHQGGEITFLVEKPTGSQASGYDLRCLFDVASKEVDYLSRDKPRIPTRTREEVRIIDGCYILPRRIFDLIYEATKMAPEPARGMRGIFDYIAKRGLATMRGVPIRGWWENINDQPTLGRVLRRQYDDLQQ